MARAAMTAESAELIGNNITTAFQARLNGGESLLEAVSHMIHTYGTDMVVAWMADVAADITRFVPSRQFPRIEAVLKIEHYDRESSTAQAEFRANMHMKG